MYELQDGYVESIIGINFTTEDITDFLELINQDFLHVTHGRNQDLEKGDAKPWGAKHLKNISFHHTPFCHVSKPVNIIWWRALGTWLRICNASIYQP